MSITVLSCAMVLDPDFHLSIQVITQGAYVHGFCSLCFTSCRQKSQLQEFYGHKISELSPLQPSKLSRNVLQSLALSDIQKSIASYISPTVGLHLRRGKKNSFCRPEFPMFCKPVVSICLFLFGPEMVMWSAFPFKVP